MNNEKLETLCLSLFLSPPLCLAVFELFSFLSRFERVQSYQHID